MIKMTQRKRIKNPRSNTHMIIQQTALAFGCRYFISKSCSKNGRPMVVRAIYPHKRMQGAMPTSHRRINLNSNQLMPTSARDDVGIVPYNILFLHAERHPYSGAVVFIISDFLRCTFRTADGSCRH